MTELGQLAGGTIRGLRERASARRRQGEPAPIIAEANDGVVPAAAAIRAEDTPASSSDVKRYRRTALIIACALFMQNLDTTILATALPTIARDFGVPPAGMSLALTSYLLALALFIPASGSTADRFGARPLFQCAIALFVAGSVACGLSNSLEALVIARFGQGIGGAMMVPVGRLVLLRTVARRDLVAAMSWLAMPALIGPILGPPVGGMIVTYLDWRWIFWINVPLGVLGIVLVGRYIGNVQAERPPAFDRSGFVISGITLSSLLFGLQLLSRAGNARVAIPLIAIGVAGCLFYVRHAGRVARPILDLSLLQLPTFRLSVMGGTLIRITQGAQPFLLPMMMQLAFGFTAARSGTITVATAIGSFAMKSTARRILRRFGFRTSLLTIGLITPFLYAICGFFGPGWPMPAIFAVLLVCGFLASLQFTAYNTIAYDEVERPRMSAATSFYSTFQQISLSLGICTAATALTVSMRMRGHATPHFVDFSTAYWIITAISLSAVFVNRQFDRSAGAELTGGPADRG